MILIFVLVRHTMEQEQVKYYVFYSSYHAKDIVQALLMSPSMEQVYIILCFYIFLRKRNSRGPAYVSNYGTSMILCFYIFLRKRNSTGPAYVSKYEIGIIL